MKYRLCEECKLYIPSDEKEPENHIHKMIEIEGCPCGSEKSDGCGQTGCPLYLIENKI